MPTAAVSLVTWNSEAYIARCLRALFDQTFADFSVTIVDNASTDRTLDMIRALPFAGRIQIIANPTNIGFAAAQNRGIRESDSEYVLALNPDVLLTPPYLQSMIDALSESARIGSANGKLFQISSEDFHAASGVDFGERPIDSMGLFMQRSRRQYLRGYQQISPPDHDQPARIFGPDGAAPLYRRAMLDEIQLNGEFFDEDFVTHKEDVDLAWRAQLYGWESVYVPAACAYHIRGFRIGGRRAVSASVKRVAVRNRWLMMVKNEIPALLLRDLLPVLVYDIGILGYMLLFEQSSLPAIADFFRLLSTMRQKRAIIQSQRRRTAAEMGQWFR